MKKEASLYKKLDNQKAQCQVCNHYCNIPKEKVGKCGIRKNIDGKIYLLNYGKVMGAHIDPIEKKPLYHFLPDSKVLSLGGLGCNFRCSFCQNWDTAQFPVVKAKEIGRDQTTELIKELGHDFSPKEVVEYTLEHNLPSIAYTYNEPTIWFEYVFDTCLEAQKEGIKNVLVTNGYISRQAFSKISNHIDAANIDLKSFDEDFYRKHCRAELSVVKDNIRKFHKAGIWIELTTLIIPGENDSEKEISKLAEFICTVDTSIPVHFSKFHPSYRMLDKSVTSDEKMESCVRIAQEIGLEYVYAGNTSYGRDTFCPGCGEVVIQRTWSSTDTFGVEVKDSVGVCRKCGYDLAGIFEN